MGFQLSICLIFCFSWSIKVKFCVLLRTSSSKTQMLFLNKNIFQEYWLLCSRFIAFTFDLCGLCLLSVICKQWLKQYNSHIDQSELLTRFQTDFMSSVWNFYCWVADVPLGESFLAMRSKEKWLHSQAILVSKKKFIHYRWYTHWNGVWKKALEDHNNIMLCYILCLFQRKLTLLLFMRHVRRI